MSMTNNSVLLVLLVEKKAPPGPWPQSHNTGNLNFISISLVKAFKKEDLEESSKSFIWWLRKLSFLPAFVVLYLLVTTTGGWRIDRI